jgi:hypothetical protein
MKDISNHQKGDDETNHHEGKIVVSGSLKGRGYAIAC